MRFDEVRPATCRRAGVKIRGLWGFLDEAGKWAVKPRYDWVSYYVEGIAFVGVCGRSYFIDTEGQRIPPRVVRAERLHSWPWKGIPRHLPRAIDDNDYAKMSPLSAPKGYTGHRGGNKHWPRGAEPRYWPTD